MVFPVFRRGREYRKRSQVPAAAALSAIGFPCSFQPPRASRHLRIAKLVRANITREKLRGHRTIEGCSL